MNENLVIIYKDYGRINQNSFNSDEVFTLGNPRKKAYKEIRILAYEKYINRKEYYDDKFIEKGFSVKHISLHA